MGLILSVPESMSYVRILLKKDEVSKAMSALQKAGILHVEPVGKLPEEDREALREELELVKKLISLADTLEGFYETPKVVEIREEFELSELPRHIRRLIKDLEGKNEIITTLLNNIEKLNEELSNLQRTLRYLEPLESFLRDYKVQELNYLGELLFSKLLYGKEPSVAAFLSSLPEGVVKVAEGKVEEEVVLLVAGLKHQWDEVLELTNKFKLEELSLPNTSKKVSAYLAEIKERTGVLEKELSKVREELEDELSAVASSVAVGKLLGEAYEERLQALLKAAAGDYLTAIEGWVSTSDLHTLEDVISRNVSTYYVAEVNADKEPPSKLKNPEPVKPFELITKLYGVPSHKEWDPTPILMYSFMVFFGTMFADAVYGILMFILVKYVLERSGLVDNPYSEGYLTLKKLLLTLSISATVFGVLSNTFAGFSIIKTPTGWAFAPATENSIVPSILNFTNPIWFLQFALVVGLIHINIGHVISLVRGVKEKDLGRIMTEVGIFIGEFFGIPYILHSTMHFDILPLTPAMLNIFLYGSLAGLAIIIAGAIKSSGGQGIILWLFTVTGLLGDVLSYSRLAGLGLATYMMARSFNSLAISLGAALGGMVPVVGLVLGVVAAGFVMLVMNLITIIFGIIGAFVHSLRLCFVEFLPKWYEGSGIEFTPLSAKIPRHVVIGRSV
ncbi:MAG: hypothetical protein J7L55_04680 [Desulfurococcales archaeon]|nr:hypothetical protein [Desulfurococcales archaeon]